MKIMVINCGSSSLKFQIFDIDDKKNNVMAKGLVEEIGRETSKLHYKNEKMKKDEEITKEIEAKDHTEALEEVAKLLIDSKIGIFKDKIQVDAVGHRVVHGGEKFSKSAFITEGVKEVIQECFDIAPLHNPPNYQGIVAAEKIFPDVPQVAVFDTAFHQTMHKEAYIYGLPYELYERYHIRKYGFHGTSHEYVSQRAAEILKKDYKKIKIITCHLGNGCSITAIKNGQSTDTSMGFTPLEGLVMGTRTGDMDPYVVLYIMEKEHLNTKEMNDLLNKKSGLKGISGISNDMREIMDAAANGNIRAQYAIDIFTYRITKYIGSYAAAMGGVDAVVFTGGIGENAPAIRQQALEPLEFMGLKIDKKANESKEKEKIISARNSKIKVLVIPTNEELMIARDTAEICNNIK
ncbi:MAG TPA: acetate kinase [Candidatus Goldiibacteriota bacterium]|nr:acetate kinase [Candidatus Goldiibacteriota bacterium]